MQSRQKLSLLFSKKGLKMNKELLKEIVDNIKESADELLDRNKKMDLVEQGELIAYAEVLNIIQDSVSGYDVKEVGLDFDIDNRYLLSKQVK